MLDVEQFSEEIKKDIQILIGDDLQREKCTEVLNKKYNIKGIKIKGKEIISTLVYPFTRSHGNKSFGAERFDGYSCNMACSEVHADDFSNSLGKTLGKKYKTYFIPENPQHNNYLSNLLELKWSNLKHQHLILMDIALLYMDYELLDLLLRRHDEMDQVINLGKSTILCMFNAPIFHQLKDRIAGVDTIGGYDPSSMIFDKYSIIPSLCIFNELLENEKDSIAEPLSMLFNHCIKNIDKNENNIAYLLDYLAIKPRLDSLFEHYFNKVKLIIDEKLACLWKDNYKSYEPELKKRKYNASPYFTKVVACTFDESFIKNIKYKLPRDFIEHDLLPHLPFFYKVELCSFFGNTIFMTILKEIQQQLKEVIKVRNLKVLQIINKELVISKEERDNNIVGLINSFLRYTNCTHIVTMIHSIKMVNTFRDGRFRDGLCGLSSYSHEKNCYVDEDDFCGINYDFSEVELIIEKMLNQCKIDPSESSFKKLHNQISNIDLHIKNIVYYTTSEMCLHTNYSYGKFLGKVKKMLTKHQEDFFEKTIFQEYFQSVHKQLSDLKDDLSMNIKSKKYLQKTERILKPCEKYFENEKEYRKSFKKWYRTISDLILKMFPNYPECREIKKILELCKGHYKNLISGITEITELLQTIHEKLLSRSTNILPGAAEECYQEIKKMLNQYKEENKEFIKPLQRKLERECTILTGCQCKKELMLRLQEFFKELEQILQPRCTISQPQLQFLLSSANIRL